MKTGSVRLLACEGNAEPPRLRGASVRDPGGPCGGRNGLALRAGRFDGAFRLAVGDFELPVAGVAGLLL